MTAVTISTKTALDLIAALNSAENFAEARRLTHILSREMRGDLCARPRVVMNVVVKASEQDEETARLQKALSDLELSHSEGRIAIAKIEGIRKEIADYRGGIAPGSLLSRIVGIANAN